MNVNRNTMLGSLMLLRNQGWRPAVVIDIGAQVGTEDLYQAFPESKHLMVEPVEENRPALLEVAARLPDAEVIIAAADSRSGETFLHVSANAERAAISERADARPNRPQVRRIPAFSVDDLCGARSLAGPYLLKVDVDGRELHVLEGATVTLRDAPCVVVETVLFGSGANNFGRVIDFMKERDFVVHDIVNPLYRPSDMALWQVDTVFVKSDGEFRRNQAFGDAATMKELAGG